MNDLFLARALHVLAVVIWIGGVWMVTTIVLPTVRSGQLGADRVRALRAIEQRFVWHARAAVIVVGATGFYMVVRLNLWPRFQLPQFWWMHAMAGIWVLFVLMLFVIEPLSPRRRLEDDQAADQALARLFRGHLVLLALASITILGAVAGSHGWLF